jgi:hypothetical protein
MLGCEVWPIFRSLLVSSLRHGLWSLLPRAGFPFSSIRLRTIIRLESDLDSLLGGGVQECLCSGCTFLEIHVAYSGSFLFLEHADSGLDLVEITSAIDNH